MTAALIVSGRAPAAGLRKGTQSLKIVVEAKVEVDALHLPIGDDVNAGPQLVIDGEADGIADGLRAVVRAEQFRLARGIVAELGVPARERPAADDGRREQRQSG